MQFESSTTINASSAHIFSIYANVADWPRWDPDVKAASIDGPLTSGATGVVVPHGGPKSKLAFTHVLSNKSLTME